MPEMNQSKKLSCWSLEDAWVVGHILVVRRSLQRHATVGKEAPWPPGNTSSTNMSGGSEQLSTSHGDADRRRDHLYGQSIDR